MINAAKKKYENMSALRARVARTALTNDFCAIAVDSAMLMTLPHLLKKHSNDLTSCKLPLQSLLYVILVKLVMVSSRLAPIQLILSITEMV